MEASMKSDPELLEECISGNAQAFAQIVERYQSLICAIAYSAIGDLGLSEDLAQETFITAWKRLGELRDWTKLRAWLSGIARNLISNSIRRRRRDVMRHARPLEEAREMTSSVPTPREHAISKEQEAILWRTLQEIPASYREPLILYYREQRSVQRVAEALELSEDAVKQRLARGRQMLKDQVAAFVEETLAGTGPKKVFTIAVLAALPAAAPQVAFLGAATTVTKATAAAKSAAATGLAGAVLGPLLGMLGGFLGAWASIKNTRSPRERRFMLKMAWIAIAYVLGFLGIFFFSLITLSSRVPLSTLICIVVALCGVYAIGLVVLIQWSNHRQRQIQIEDGTYVDPSEIRKKFLKQPFKMSKAALYGSLGGSIFGSVAWIFPLSYLAKDWIVALVVIFVAITIFVISTKACARAPRSYYRNVTGALVGAGVLNLVVVNLRWNSWMGFYRQSLLYQPSGDLPLWAMNLLIVTVFGCLVLVFFIKDRTQRLLVHESKKENS